MKISLLRSSVAIAGLLAFTVTASAASPFGTWKRPDGSTAKVSDCGGKMCGVVTSGKKSGFKMFKGIPKTGANTWAGDMWHPKMGSWMTFNGTVKLSGNQLSVKGCAIGKSMCDSETWTR
ncbi:MAG: hypothetical protein C0606_00280 [Hyphomicrobiales bacterium]|nr:MAG: hypothetical protein C0606_00280 [Hyphomicrobiales bacterium]